MNKKLAALIVLATPYIYQLAFLSANSQRDFAGVGGEVFLPPLLLLAAYFLYNFTGKRHVKRHERFTARGADGITIKWSDFGRAISKLAELEDMIDGD